ncbi:hypothetical protein OIY81_1055 [Cryptosporidium canis]|nr:hypothetical protein OIY81_1055 [Cryptosporidium canis]
MGGDGGSIPKRGDVVKTKGYGFKRNLGGMGYMPNAQVKLTNEETSTKLKLHERWTKCYLSNEPLNPPVVTCAHGLLYNKEAVINKLLNKSKVAPHIKNLSSVYEIKNKFNNSLNCFICPVTNRNLDYFTKASYFKCCKHIIDSSAFRIKDSNKTKIKENDTLEQERVCIHCNSVISSPLNEIRLFSNLAE